MLTRLCTATAVLAVAVAGCPPLAQAEPEPLTADAAFEQRAPLHSCGRLRMLPPPHDIPPDYLTCMRQARAAGTGAELVTTVANFFLEDTTTYYRVYSADRDVEVFVDNNDRGNPGFSHYYCPIPDTDLSFEPPSC
ncbi:hypothetical protein [Mycobacteroides franklinii]|uniref:hypothetical protein n=1 Tax=Mycobacteroides franklinii TaxID=948102 RepID=UPI00099380AC|nr:hypothetical protein [Mycobacteroides franklinii]